MSSVYKEKGVTTYFPMNLTQSSYRTEISMAETILVVDDDHTICAFIKAVLVEKGYAVYCAANGAVALDLIAHHPPRLILLDAHMPVMDGLAFLHQYDRLPLPQASIIVMSTKDDSLTRAMVLHTHGFLETPVERDRLLLVIRRYV